MPTYEYACRNCGERLEAVQSFADAPLEVCPHCGGELRKVFGSVGIVFKGSGFYKTDSRKSTSSRAASTSESSTSSTSESTSTTPGDTPATEPASHAHPHPHPAPTPAPSAPATAPSAPSTSSTPS